MKKRISPVFIVVLLIIIVAAAGVGNLVLQKYMPGTETMDSSEYFGVSSDTETALVLNWEILEDRGRMIDDNIYLDIDTVSTYINSRFFWDEQNQEMLFTLPEEVIELKPDSTEYTVSGETVQEDIPAIVSQDDSWYVSLAFLSTYTEMQCEVYENPSRVVMFTEEGSVEKADAAMDYSIREKGGIKSLILTSGEEGDSLYIIEELENWTKVATADGYTGYIRSSALEESYEEEIVFDSSLPEYTSITKDYKINLGWHLMTNTAGNQELSEKISGCTGLTTISPTWFTFADSSGNLVDLSDADYVTQAHAAGLEVWGMIENLNTEVSTLEVLSLRENRTRVIEQLMSAASAVGLDGINVDLENITEEMAPYYVQFVRELSVACRKACLVLSVDVPVSQSYNAYYNRSELGVMADYVIIMGYDEHYSGSEEAGSVASLSFVENGITEALEEVPKEKLINALPFYTRLWIQPFGSSIISSETMGMDEASAYVEEHDMEVYWDGSVSQYVAEVQDDEALYQIWLEEEESIEAKMQLVQEYELAGAAFWQLGYQRNTVWEIIAEYLQ